MHTQGGTLECGVTLQYGKGFAGIIGARLAQKMNLPKAGEHQLRVDISHSEQGLHWGRCFNEVNAVESLFKPVGNFTQGYWIETTGPLTLHLTVDVIAGGWHWKCLGARFKGFPIPLWLIPQTKAFKTN